MRKRGDRAWCRRRVVHGRERWQVVAVIGGSRTTRVYPSESEARRQVAILSAALDAGQLDAPVTWDEAVEAFLEARKAEGRRQGTRDTYRYRLAAVGRALGDVDPLTLTEAQGRAYAAGREASAATICGELDAVTILQRWMVGRGWMPTATWSSVPRPDVTSTKRHLRPDEVGKFLRAAARLAVAPPGEARIADWERWPAAAWLLLHGLRTAEAQNLLVGDVDLVTGVVYVADRAGARTKTKSSARAVPILSEEALECLRETYRGLDPNEPAFKTGRLGAARGRTKWFARRCAITCDEAGVPRVSPHELRHTVATAAVVAGADMHSVQWLLGHSDARVTSRTYAHAEAAVRARGASRVVGEYLDRIVRATPSLKALP